MAASKPFPAAYVLFAPYDGLNQATTPSTYRLGARPPQVSTTAPAVELHCTALSADRPKPIPSDLD